jgi:Putative auto-transporter adhesin, head GIN domain
MDINITNQYKGFIIRDTKLLSFPEGFCVPNNRANMKEQSFVVGSDLVLNLETIIGKVTIKSVDQEKLTIQAKSDNKTLSEMEISQSGNEVIVKGPENAGGMTIISGGSVIRNFSGNSISIGNVRMTGTARSVVISDDGVWINGKRVDGNGAESDKLDNRDPLEVTIGIPSHIVPDLVLGQVGELECKTTVNEVTVDSQGQCAWVFGTVDSFSGDISGQTKIRVDKLSDGLNLDLLGQSNIQIPNFKGDLKLDISGQSKVSLAGTFSSIKVDISGQASVDTRGTVSGNLSADASGMAHYQHSGTVSGRVKERKSGLASVSIIQ